MDAQITSFFIILSILWFLMYWVLGGVFFAVITIIRLGRLRKLRFSCLFSLLALVVGVASAYFGILGSQDAVSDCLATSVTRAEKVTAVFGCGFASILGAFLLGALALTIGGFIIMLLSKSKTKPWITLEPEMDGPESQEPSQIETKSKFF
jgi:hypothetical protein